MDSIRVSELAKELGLTSKEVIEKFGEIDIIVKSHSNTVNPTQIRKLKEHLGVLPQKSSAKPKAFIVKKAKAQTAETKPEETKSSEAKAEKNKIEKVQKVEKKEIKEQSSEAKKEEKPVVRVERTKIEYPKNQSRIEIVRKAPAKGVNIVKNIGTKSVSKDEKQSPAKSSQEKKLVERRIIPQEIYEGKGGPASKRKGDSRKKDKDFNSKKEDQEMISLEKRLLKNIRKKLTKKKRKKK